MNILKMKRGDRYIHIYTHTNIHKDQEAIKKKEYRFWKFKKNISLKEKFIKK